MGPRAFVAQRLADFLLHHGDLDARIDRLELRDCRAQRSATAAPWLARWAPVIDERGIAPNPAVDAAAMLVAACLFVRHARQGRAWQRRLQWSASSVMSVAALSLSILSCCLVTMLILSSIAGDGWTLPAFKRLNQLVAGTAKDGASPPSSPFLTRALLDRYLFLSSLWCILVSVLLTAARAVWTFLNPTGSAVKATVDAAVLVTAGASAVVLWLAYVHLSLFRRTLHGDVDHGLSPGLMHALQHGASSFVAFCLFHKLLPSGSSAAAGPRARHPRKQGPLDPELVQRMSNLAREARERLRARKARHLRRTYSEGNFHVPASPASPGKATSPGKARVRRQSSGPGVLSPVLGSPASPGTTKLRRKSSGPGGMSPLRQQQSPLREISQAGPGLSGRDLLAKLRQEACVKKSVSTNSLTSMPLVLVPELTEEDMTF